MEKTATPHFSQGEFGYLALLLQKHQVTGICLQQQQQKPQRLRINSILARAGVGDKENGHLFPDPLLLHYMLGQP